VPRQRNHRGDHLARFEATTGYVVLTESVWGDPIRRFVILSVVFSFFSLFVGANLARAAAHSAKPPGPRSGSVNFATAAGKRATFSFTGTQAAWVSTIASKPRIGYGEPRRERGGHSEHARNGDQTLP
jgi:hypothetical protein